MKKIISLSLVLALLAIFCGEVNSFGEDLEKFLRSADPCEKWVDWSEGEDQLVTPLLREGFASHKLSPAEIIFLSAKENGVNPVLLLAILEDQRQLVSIPAVVGNFEERLFLAMGFAIDENGFSRYGGFFPQLVATSFQMWLGYQQETPFEDFYESYFQGGANLNGLETVYSFYAQEFSEIIGVPHNFSLEFLDVFIDFQSSEMNSMVIQIFLEKRGSILADRNLFRQLSIDSSVNYQNPPCEE